jgi:hypothetical protein
MIQFHPNMYYLVNSQLYYMHLNYFHYVLLMIDRLSREKVMIMNDRMEVEVWRIYIQHYCLIEECNILVPKRMNDIFNN